MPLYSAPRLAFGKGRYARPPAGGCPSMPYGIATSPEGRGKNALMRVLRHVLAPPLGELSPQVTERASKDGRIHINA